MPASQAEFVEVAVICLFPCLVFGTALVQQHATALFVAGQILLWVAILAAAEVIIVLHSGFAFAVLIAMLVAVRAARVVAPVAALDMAYDAVNGLIFLVAGAAIFAFRREVLERQLKAFFAWSIPLLLVQLYGKPSWIQALRTDAHTAASGGSREEMLPSLFDSNSANLSTTQARPAGLLHANNFLSIVVLFGLAVIFRRSRVRSIQAMDVFTMAVLVLSMAKIGYLSFIVFSVIYLVRGPADTRARIGKLWLLLGVFLGTFYLLFPGIFMFDMSLNNAILNYAVRMADLQAVLTGVSMVDVVQINGVGGAQLAVVGLEAGTQSGYSVAAKYARFLVPLAMITVALFALRFRRIPRHDSELRDLSLNGVLLLFLTPLITSFAGNPFFAFSLAGLALPWVAVPSRRELE